MSSRLDLTNVPRGHHLRYVDDVAVLILNDTENRFNLNSIGAIEKCMDEVERNESTKALIFTGIGKFFSNGIDLNWVSTQHPPVVRQYFMALKSFIIRVATFPVPTVAAINGHAFAAGALLPLVCDFRVMHSGKGWFSLPEIHIKLPFTPFFSEIIELKSPNPQVIRDMVLWGTRYTPDEALKASLLDAVVPTQDLVPFSCDLAKRSLGKNGIDRSMMATMKNDLYGNRLRSKNILRDEIGTSKL
ncbi:uncharacterized protein [Amphiura filiformis]|uniref:uncharacterized protein n=1 Tax=Amphiura filiformis TaxID=82378 RepID=UPI003B213BCC